jgi:hypothetical protein
MPNPDHMAQMMKGVDAWNAWREENRDIEPDLIPFTHHIEWTIYGKDVMDLTIFGLRSM